MVMVIVVIIIVISTPPAENGCSSSKTSIAIAGYCRLLRCCSGRVMASYSVAYEACECLGSSHVTYEQFPDHPNP